MSIGNLNKLKGKLVEKQKTYEQCAKYLGISVTTFSTKMNGKGKFYVNEVNELAKLLELTTQERIDIFLN